MGLCRDILEVAKFRTIEQVVENTGRLAIANNCCYYDEFGEEQLLPEAAEAFEYAKQYKKILQENREKVYN